MNKKWLLLITIIFFMPLMVFASPTASLETSASSIENGGTVTATVVLSEVSEWNVSVYGNGAATCSTNENAITPDGHNITKRVSVSCTAAREGIITFSASGSIKNEEGETTNVSIIKEIEVTKPKSRDNSLKDLKVDGKTVPNFNKDNTSYTVTGQYGGTVNISASPTDSKARVRGDGNKSVKVGSNTFQVVVTAENGDERTYTVVVNRQASDSRSSNNNLKSLTISKGNLDFSKNKTSYSLTLEHDVNEIEINATPEDGKAKVSGTGKKQLVDYNNDFTITVTAENGATKNYTIRIDRKDKDGSIKKRSSDNTAKSIKVTNLDVNIYFSKDKKEYNVSVGEDIELIEFEVEPNDPTAKVTILNNKNLKAGANLVVVKITAENGDENDYKFNVYKEGEVEEEEEEEEKPQEEVKETPPDNTWMFIFGGEMLLFLILVAIIIKRVKKNKAIDKEEEKIEEKPEENPEKKD